MDTVAHNLEVVNNKIADAAKGKKVTLVAVSKTKSCEDITAAYEAGQHIFGENKMQELRGKIEDIPQRDISWQFIGKLQSNKVKYIDNSINCIQSVDSTELLEMLDKHLSLTEQNKMDVLLQVNIGNEPQKNGFLLSGFEKTVENLQRFDKINIKGLMCIPPYGARADGYFIKLHDIFMSLRDREIPGVSMEFLSMGMTGDFETAIKCGSNMVRVGSGIFGARL